MLRQAVAVLPMRCCSVLSRRAVALLTPCPNSLHASAAAATAPTCHRYLASPLLRCRVSAQVFPKMLDTYLLVLYMAMVPVVYLQYAWLHTWITVYHSGAVAVFMWVSSSLAGGAS